MGAGCARVAVGVGKPEAAPSGRPRACRRAPSLSLPHRGRGRKAGWIPASAGMTDGGGLRKGRRWVGKPEEAPFGRPRACRRAPSLSLPHRGRGRKEGAPTRGAPTGGMDSRFRGNDGWGRVAQGSPLGGEAGGGALWAPARLPTRALSQSPPGGRGRREGRPQGAPLREGWIPAFAGMTVCCADITGYRGVMVSLSLSRARTGRRPGYGLLRPARPVWIRRRGLEDRCGGKPPRAGAVGIGEAAPVDEVVLGGELTAR